MNFFNQFLKKSKETAAIPIQSFTKRRESSTKRRESLSKGKEEETSKKNEEDDAGELLEPFNNTKREQKKKSSTLELESTKGKKFIEVYELGSELGTGAFSVVNRAVRRKDPSIEYAVKCVNRKSLSEDDSKAILEEVNILREFDHPNVTKLFDFFEEKSHYYLVMEELMGGELFDRVVQKLCYNEKEARNTCKILLEAVGYCHSNSVAHRDLKPENLLLKSDQNDSDIKIADFGFAKKVLTPNSLTTQCGTPGYVAPEILEGLPYDTKADMWSIGVILYILLGGYPPFIEKNQRVLFRRIRNADYQFHEEYWGTISSDAKGLICLLLTKDPAKRITASEALENKWICEEDVNLGSSNLGKNLDRLKAFNAERKFKAGVKAIMAVNKIHSLGLTLNASLK